MEPLAERPPGGLREELAQHLRDALTHLYDPIYHPPESLWVVTGCDPQQGVEAVQAVLIEAIEELKPAPSVPLSARVRRIYELLSCRYIRGLTQEKTAERLGITPRHLRRKQKEAIQVLAQRLWEGRPKASSPAATAIAEDTVPRDGARPSRTIPSGIRTPEWRSQVREELASLRKSALGAVANVEETIRAVVELETSLAAKRGVRLEIERVQPSLLAAIHPSALRQVLIAATGRIAQHMSSGRITFYAGSEEGDVSIAIVGCPAVVDGTPNSDLIREIVAAQGGSVEICVEGERISFWVELPSADEITVLVVDDNVDLVHFYQRYTTGTRYHIVHAARGQRVFEIIKASAPDIIVLDVMLPDVDGWELLVHLYEHPETRSIPIIVCSVVREEELALSLGAALYLPKPVRRRQFIQALDQVLSRALA